MTTVLQYLVIAAVIALVLFGLALLLFGRGEQMPPLAARTSPANLPAQDIEGDDVRSVKFSLAVRGYRMSDVDWTLDRLAEELDRTKKRLQELEPGPAAPNPALGHDPATADPRVVDGAPASAPTASLAAASAPTASAPTASGPTASAPTAGDTSADLFANDPPPPGDGQDTTTTESVR